VCRGFFLDLMSSDEEALENDDVDAHLADMIGNWNGAIFEAFDAVLEEESGGESESDEGDEGRALQKPRQLVANPFPDLEEVSARSLLIEDCPCDESVDALLSVELVTVVTLRKVLFVLCGRSPSEFVSVLKDSGSVRKTTCGRQWVKGDWIYHCKNCELDPQVFFFFFFVGS
jgi:hypothetical protein